VKGRYGDVFGEVFGEVFWEEAIGFVLYGDDVGDDDSDDDIVLYCLLVLPFHFNPFLCMCLIID
jgi:hypothetical protein